jgi:hypothetical protein
MHAHVLLRQHRRASANERTSSVAMLATIIPVRSQPAVEREIDTPVAAAM